MSTVIVTLYATWTPAHAVLESTPAVAAMLEACEDEADPSR